MRCIFRLTLLTTLLFSTALLAEKFPEIISLSVGGKLFQHISVATLRSQGGMLAQQFSDEKYDMAQNDAIDGVYVIHRSSRRFRDILDYLYSPENFAPQSSLHAKELFVEAQFYDLEHLQRTIAESELQAYLSGREKSYRYEMWKALENETLLITQEADVFALRTESGHILTTASDIESLQKAIETQKNLVIVVEKSGGNLIINIKTQKIVAEIHPVPVDVIAFGYHPKNYQHKNYYERQEADPRVIQARKRNREMAYEYAVTTINNLHEYYLCGQPIGPYAGRAYHVYDIMNGETSNLFPRSYDTLEKCLEAKEQIMSAIRH